MGDVRNNTGERSLDEAAGRHAFLAIIDCIIGSGFTRDKRSHKDMTDDCHGNCIATPENRPADRSAARILRRCGSRDPHRGACAGTLWRARLCPRSEEHTSELQSLMRTSYAAFCLTKQTHGYRSHPSMKHPRIHHKTDTRKTTR